MTGWRSLAMMGAALLLLAGSSVAMAHGDDGTPHSQVVTVAGAGRQLELAMSSDRGTVGQPVHFEGRVLDATGQTISGTVHYDLEVVNNEYGEVVFTTGFDVADASFVWDYQFWDGTEHGVRVLASPPAGASPTFTPLEFNQKFLVTPVPPPTWVQVRALAYLLILVAIGLVAGLSLGGRGSPRHGRTAVLRQPIRES